MQGQLDYQPARFRRRRWPTFVAACIAGLGLVWLVRTAKVRYLDSEHYKPAFWVMHDAESSDAKLRESADLELLECLGKSKLSKRALAKAVERALTAQANNSATWNCYRGQFVEKARAAGYVTDSQWTQYWEHAFPPFLRTATAAAPGQSPTIELACDPHSWMYSGGGVAVSYHATSLWVGRVRCDPACLGDWNFEVIPNWAIHSGFTPAQPLPTIARPPTDAPGGPVLVAAEADVTVYTETPPGAAVPPSPVHYTKRVTAVVNLPPGLTPVECDFSPQHRQAVRAGLQVREVRVGAASANGFPDLSFQFDGPAPPVSLCFNVQLAKRGDSRGWPMGVLLCPAGQACRVEFGHPIAGFEGPAADIILKPSAELAAKNNIQTIWGEEVDIKGVPLRPTK